MTDAPSSPSGRALGGHCPHCGEGKLFASWLEFRSSCAVCGLDFQAIDVGDGGAYITICVIGALTTLLMAMTEVTFSPPYWVHAVLWIPFIVFGSLLSLHWCKAWMLAVSYKHGHGKEE